MSYGDELKRLREERDALWFIYANHGCETQDQVDETYARLCELEDLIAQQAT